MNRAQIKQAYDSAMKRLNAWGMLLTGRIAGTLRAEDPRSKGYRDLFQKLLVLRAEVNALTAVLVAKGVMTTEEFTAQITDEAEFLNLEYEKRFPGVRSTEAGLEVFDPKAAAAHMKGWPT